MMNMFSLYCCRYYLSHFQILSPFSNLFSTFLCLRHVQFFMFFAMFRVFTIFKVFKVSNVFEVFKASKLFQVFKVYKCAKLAKFSTWSEFSKFANLSKYFQFCCGYSCYVKSRQTGTQCNLIPKSRQVS